MRVECPPDPLLAADNSTLTPTLTAWLTTAVCAAGHERVDGRARSPHGVAGDSGLGSHGFSLEFQLQLTPAEVSEMIVSCCNLRAAQLYANRRGFGCTQAGCTCVIQCALRWTAPSKSCMLSMLILSFASLVAYQLRRLYSARDLRACAAGASDVSVNR